MMREFVDGSERYGDNIGPSRADIAWANSLGDWEIKEKNPPKLATVEKSPKPSNVLAIINLLPPTWRGPVLAGAALGAVVLTSACGAAEVSAEEENLLGESEVVIAGQSLPLTADIDPFLILPFPGDHNVKVQQGWIWGDGDVHRGIDFIRGTV